MAFDSMTLSAIVGELKPRLIGAKINKIHQPDPHTILLKCHSQAGQLRLLLSAHPENGRVVCTESTKENPPKAPMFLMVLRKWLEGARITDFSCTEGERVATLDAEGRDELADPAPLHLVIEIMGKHSNIILYNAEKQIIDGIRRYGSHLSRYREVLPGKPYLPPPPMERLSLPPSSEEELAALFYAHPDQELAAILRREIMGISPLLADHVLASSGMEEGLSPDQLGEYEIHCIYTILQDLGEMYEKNSFQPHLRQQKGRFLDFAAIAPAVWPQDELQSAESMNQAVDLFYRQREEEQQFRKAYNDLNRSLRHHLARLNKKISLEETDLCQSEAADIYKDSGDLLSAYLWHLSKGMDSVELPSFADPEEKILVKLDPALTPQENVQRYYRRYAKAKKARGSIQKQLEQNYREREYLLSIEQAMNDCGSLEELSAVEREAVSAGYHKAGAPQKPGTKAGSEKRAPALPPRKVISAEGFTILIGRNNKQNDRLSLNQAAEHDIWLHAQKMPGSHVIIVSHGQEIPENTLAEAAAYAAWFSKGRDSNQVPVDYLPAGKLRKPPGSHPGYVIFSGQRTLYVQPREPQELKEEQD